MNILGFYKKLNLTLLEKDGTYYVANKKTKKVICKGDEERCTKVFVMMMAGFIEEGQV